MAQCDLAKMLGFSERTASIQAKAGRLKRFEHGVSAAGRRKYSRALVDRELQRQWQGAVRRQDRQLDQPDENK